MYTIDDEVREKLERFLENGIDVSRFQFREDADKSHFFVMYEDYINLFAQEARKQTDVEIQVEITSTYDANVIIEGRDICHVYFTSDLKTIKMSTYETLDNPFLVFCIKVLMTTIKELAEIVNTFASLIQKMGIEKTALEEVESKLSKDLNKKKEFKGIYNTVPKDVYNSINKIQKIQKSILKDVDKYKVTKKKKDIDK